MIIEKVRLLKHLRAGAKEYTVGVYSTPIPEDILGEIHRGDVVQVLESRPSPPPVSSPEVKSVWEKKEEPVKPVEPKISPTSEKKPVRRARRISNGSG